MWTKIDDRFNNHPKIAQAGPFATLLYIKGLVYCNQYLTDGFIPETVARTLIDWQPEADAFASKRPPDNQALARRLLEHLLWESVDGGYMVHDYLEYQMSKADAEKRKRQQKRAGRLGGQASAQARAQAFGQASAQAFGQPNGNQALEQNASKPQAKGSGSGSGNEVYSTNYISSTDPEEPDLRTDDFPELDDFDAEPWDGDDVPY